MTLSEELLDTAKSLLRRNRNKPTQGDIRRSISSVYYSLFHFLTDAGSVRLVSNETQQHALARTFSHTSMREICEVVIKQPLPPLLIPYLGPVVPDELKQVAARFLSLQDSRQDADYNVSRAFTREEGQANINEVEDALAAWKLIPEAIAKPFLVLLLIGKRPLR